MKLKFTQILALLFFMTLNAQNKTLRNSLEIQTTLKFDNVVEKSRAIDLFVAQNKLGKGNYFESKKGNTDERGNFHQRNQQFYKGLKIEFGTLITHSNSDGKVYSINGELYNAANLNLQPSITKQQGLTIIQQSKLGASFLWEDKEQADIMNYSKPEGELLILPDAMTGKVSLAYKYDVYTTSPISRDEIYVDAHSGDIIFSNPIIKHADKINQSKSDNSVLNTNLPTRYSGNRDVETSFDATLVKYVLLDNTRGNGVVTYNNERKTVYQNKHFQDNDNNWTVAEYNNLFKDNAAFDAHWGAEKTYDFWMNTFGRNSYDDNGAQIKSYVHYRQVANQSLVNAFWNGVAMSYGDGNTSVGPLTSIDVCGHEIGHAVCTNTANLIYQNQSGAMNEGFSDIWGACIEHYGKSGALSNTPNANVWLIAEDLGSAFRSMSNPLSYGNPDTYLGTNWTTTGVEGTCTPTSNNDQCGVHNNSGVLNHWFYILTQGKSGTNNGPDQDVYNVTGIGMVKSSQIAYFAERDYLTPNSTYFDARNATIEVAQNLYCTNSPEVLAVTNAWYAVNIGNQFVSYANDVALKTIQQTANVSCNVAINPVVRFENAGTNTISNVTITYDIDGGTTTSTQWNGNLSACQVIDFPLSVSALSRGTHVLNVTTTTTSDGNSLNNTKSINIFANDSGIIGQINTFEAVTDNLVSIDEENTNLIWQRGNASATQLNNIVAQNSKVYGTNLSGLYPDSSKSYLVSQCYNLANVTNPTIEFDMAFDFETNWDLLYMQYSIDGANNWSILGANSTANTTWYNSNRLPDGTDCFNCVGSQWTGEGALVNTRGGTNKDKRHYNYSLANFGLGGTTPQSNMIFRFVFQSDEAVAEDGAIIDNFVINGTQVLGNAANTFEVFSIFPNPTNGIVTINLSSQDKVAISVFDIRGRKVFDKNYDNNNSVFSQELNLQNFGKGVYLIKVDSEGKSATKKVIIK